MSDGQVSDLSISGDVRYTYILLQLPDPLCPTSIAQDAIYLNFKIMVTSGEEIMADDKDSSPEGPNRCTEV